MASEECSQFPLFLCLFNAVAVLEQNEYILIHLTTIANYGKVFDGRYSLYA